MAFCDGSSFLMLPASCDYKRVGDGDTGPNTGGMGAYAPAALESTLVDRIREEIVGPAVRGMAAEGRPFVGTLYPGLMITADGPKVIEFNCRLGDPEAEALLPLLSSDVLDIFEACAEGSLDGMRLQWAPGACCAVVLASPGYPNAPLAADVGDGWRSLTDAAAFRAGASGRVMTVSATGTDLAEARSRAYAAVEQARFPGAVYRTDIGAFDRALS
jgi:phosphoribosylamine--glycine ligase